MITIEEYLTSTYEPECDFVDGALEERNAGEWDHSLTLSNACACLFEQCEPRGMFVLPILRLRVSSNRIRVPDLCVFLSNPRQRIPTIPPFLCVEILSDEDRMTSVEVRINDFLAMGVNTVWIIDPETRQAFTATAAEGLREVKSGILRTESPLIEMPLVEVFED